MKINIRIPNTRFVIVIWYRDNKANRTMIERPANGAALQMRMLKEKVGCNEIRALLPVDGDDIRKSMMRL